MCLDIQCCTDSVHRELVCPICLGILCLDFVGDENEHFFCKKCILEWIRCGNQRCPIGNEEISTDSFRSSRIVRSLLSDLKLFCKYEEKGCKQILSYENYEKHIFECDFNLTTCTKKGCGMAVKTSEFKSHLCKALEETKPIKTELATAKSQKTIKYKFDVDIDFGNGLMKAKTNNVTLTPQTNVEFTIFNETCIPFYEFDMVKSYKSIHIPSKSLFLMTFLKSRKKIIVTDYMNKTLNIMDTNGTLQTSTNPDGLLGKPWPICSNSRNEIFVGDWEQNKILVFDSGLNYKREFGENIMKNSSCMTIDDENDVLLYITYYIDNKVTVWDSDEGAYKNQFSVNSPEYIQICRDKIVLTSHVDAEYDEGTKHFKKVRSGLNCIFIVNKKTLVLEQAIKLHDWMDPRGLYCDKNHNILTTAFRIDDKEMRSDSRYLYILNLKGKYYNSIYLNNICVLSDMFMFENKLLFCISDIIEIITLK